MYVDIMAHELTTFTHESWTSSSRKGFVTESFPSDAWRTKAGIDGNMEDHGGRVEGMRVRVSHLSRSPTFEMGPYVEQVGLELTEIVLPLPPEYLNHMPMPLYLLILTLNAGT